VVIRQKPAALLPNGAIVPEREAYPSNSEWGRWAWSFPIREREFVFDLAARDAPYGAWVREQVTLLYTVLREFFSEPRCEGATEVYDILDNRNSQLTHKLTSGVQSITTYLGRIANKLDGRVTRRILRGNFVYTINWK